MYTYKINDDNSFTVFKDGEGVHTSRQFRLRVQAVTQANEWVQRASGKTSAEGVTLVVQNMSIDADTIFRRLTNG